jgi:ribosomal protein L11 methyltransferase
MNAIVLPLLESSAFGDGTHPTTRLCAGAIDLHCRLHSPSSVLDIGTGTGVLARIARARGTRFLVATDIDPEALSAARLNERLDAHPVPIEISDRSPDAWGTRFDLIVANILEGPLKGLAPAIASAIKPEGTLLLSGFTSLQIPSLETSYKQYGFKITTHATLENWSILELKRSEAFHQIDLN